VGYHTDEAGKQVVSKLDENMCKDIAAAGNGIYVRANNTNSGLGIVMDQVNKVQRKLYDSKTFKDFEDRFQFFLAIAFVLLVVEFFISNRKNMRLSGLKLFEVKKS
jgi:Ca-activated chloride channel family protein